MKAEFRISYFLWKARKDSNGLCPVYLRSKQNSDVQRSYNTGVKIAVAKWNKNKNEPKEKPAILIDLEGKLQATYKDLLSQGHEPDLLLLIAHLNDAKRPLGRSIVSWCDDYLTSRYSEGQKKAVKTLKSNIEDFNRAWTFDKISKPLLKAFFEHLSKKQVANNSQYKRLRALINVASHANLDISALTSFELPYSTANALKVRINWQEVKLIIEAETKSTVEQVAKDTFLLACFSGLRISDILSLSQGEIAQFHYERLQTKTKRPVYVTLHQYNETLFKKYITGISYTRQSLSKALKDVLKRAGLTKEVAITKAVGNLYQASTTPKYKEISFHSGRRFYARLLNDLGLGGEIARDELGHSFKTITDLYAGSPEHVFRVSRVRTAMVNLEKTMQDLAGLMKVA